MACDDQPSVTSHASSPVDSSVREFAEAILHTTSQPFLVLNPDLRVEMINPAFCRQFQVSEEVTVGRFLYELGNGQWNIPELRDLVSAVHTKGRRIEQYRVEHEFESIGYRVMLLDADRMPRKDEGDTKILLAISDVTEAERAQEELAGQKEYTEKVVDAVRDPLLILGWDLRVRSANQPFYDAFQVAPSQTEGRLVYELGNGQWDIPRLRELLEQILPENETFDHFEVEHQFDEIGHRTMLLNARRVDHTKLILLAIEDVTDRRRNERAQELLTGELNHRVKNLLANVQSLLRQTSRHSEDLAAFVRDFTARLESLSRTQDLLLSAEQKGVVPDDLLRLELTALGGREGESFSLDGPRIDLPGDTAQPMAMVVHELATNAAKYGALSVESGRVEVTWRVERREDGPHFCLRWREHGVPVPEKARKKGFGTEMIETGVRIGLGGSSELTFRPDGAECMLEFPLRR